ncbi:MAG: hypothetical protein ABW199_08805 [Caulobacterales bacterium]
MSETFSAGAAFDVFKKREKGGVLLSATIAYFVLMIVVVGAFIALGWGQIGAFAKAYTDFMGATMSGDPSVNDPSHPIAQAYFQSMLGIAPLYLLFIFIVYVLLAAFEAAVHRWLVRGESGGGLMGLNFGADTWRVYLGYWLWVIVLTGLYIGVIILAVVGGFAAAAVFGGGDSSGGMIGGAIIAVIMIVAFCAFLYVLVRLAPANAASVGLKKFAFFKGWTVSRGRFWSLLGAYLILAVIYLVIASIAYGVAAVIALGPMFAQIAQGGQPDPNVVMQSLSNPSTLAVLGLLYLVVFAVAMAIYLAFLGVGAKAVRVAMAEGRIGAPAA